MRKDPSCIRSKGFVLFFKNKLHHPARQLCKNLSQVFSSKHQLKLLDVYLCSIDFNDSKRSIKLVDYFGSLTLIVKWPRTDFLCSFFPFLHSLPFFFFAGGGGGSGGRQPFFITVR